MPPPTILCVDDDRDLCEILAKALRGEGYSVALAYDGDAALEAVRGSRPNLVLLDVLLPKRDGFSVLAAIRAAGGPVAQVPVILITGCSRTPAYLERASELGAAAFLTKPVPLEDLLRLVAKQIGSAGRAAPRKPKPAARSRSGSAASAGRYRVGRTAPESAGRYRRAQPASMRGSFKQLPFPALLHQLHGLRASGVLHLRSGRKHKRVEMRDGRPVAVRSNLVNECLGNWLVRTGRITQAELDESVQRMKLGEGLQGEIFVAMELLSEEELVDVLRLQAEEKLLEIFDWREGSYELELGVRLERANALAVERGPADVILHGVRTRTPLSMVDGYLSAHAKSVAVPSQNPFYRFQDLALESSDEELLRSGDGRLVIRDLLARGESVRRAAYGLLAIGLLELNVDHAEAHPQSRTATAAAVERSGERSAVSPARAEPDHSHYAADLPLRAELTALLERFRTAGNPFAVLGLAPGADEAQIRRAYAELARRTHPDRFAQASDAVIGLAEKAFATVARAHEVLQDPARRAAYEMDPKRDERERKELEEGYRALAAEREFQQGEAKLRARDWAGALASFERAVELYPDEGEYYAYHGWAYYLTEGHDPAVLRKALSLVKKGAKLAPEREKPYLFLGRLYQAAERDDLAERMFTRAVELRPDSIEALRELRLIHMRREKRKGLIGRLLRRSGPAEGKRWGKRAGPG